MAFTLREMGAMRGCELSNRICTFSRIPLLLCGAQTVRSKSGRPAKRLLQSTKWQDDLAHTYGEKWSTIKIFSQICEKEAKHYSQDWAWEIGRIIIKMRQMKKAGVWVWKCWIWDVGETSSGGSAGCWIYQRSGDRSGLVLHVETADTWMVFKATGLDEI